jgi:ribonuclease P protein subunit RPR2
MAKKKANVQETKIIAKERISILFERADEEFKDNPDLSDRYVNLARKMSMKANIPIPRDLKKKFCKSCYSYLKPGSNLKVRLHRSTLIYTCGKCGNIMRFKKQKELGKKI